jgi:hypothetical protein
MPRAAAAAIADLAIHAREEITQSLPQQRVWSRIASAAAATLGHGSQRWATASSAVVSGQATACRVQRDQRPGGLALPAGTAMPRLLATRRRVDGAARRRAAAGTARQRRGSGPRGGVCLHQGRRARRDDGAARGEAHSRVRGRKRTSAPSAR